MESHTVLHLRTESGKPLEHRACITPTVAKSLIDAGYQLHVERSNTHPDFVRIFQDSEYETAGATLVEEESWVTAPLDHIIVGLKELKEESFPLSHHMIHFAHCYKNQSGWEKVLSRFPRGHGVLYDLEFLQDENGRRVAAFGYHAGFAGAALAIKNWAWQLAHPEGEPMPGVAHFTEGRGYYENEEKLVEQIREDIMAGEKISGSKPRALIMGALGRCGRGACDLFARVGVPEENLLKWDIDETRDRPGPYQEIINSNIFVNCIYLMSKIQPFVDMDSLNAASDRKLSVVCDVSCDPNSPNNPVPIYNASTDFDNPTIAVKDVTGSTPLSVISIDHLPSLLPREASEAFSSALLPSLLELKDSSNARVWRDAEKLFQEKVTTLPQGMAGREV